MLNKKIFIVILTCINNVLSQENPQLQHYYSELLTLVMKNPFELKPYFLKLNLKINQEVIASIIEYNLEDLSQRQYQLEDII